jgi:hypothetical protein
MSGGIEELGTAGELPVGCTVTVVRCLGFEGNPWHLQLEYRHPNRAETSIRVSLLGKENEGLGLLKKRALAVLASFIEQVGVQL